MKRQQRLELQVEELQDRYRLHNVPYLGETCMYDVSKVLLDNGTSHTQEEWVQRRADEWKVGSGPEQYARDAALYRQYLRYAQTMQRKGEHPDEVQGLFLLKVWDLLKAERAKYPMMTSTRVEYNPEHALVAVHNFGYENERREEVGTTGMLPETWRVDDTAEVLLESEDYKEVIDVYTLMANKPSFLWEVTKQLKDGPTAHALVRTSNRGDGFGISSHRLDDRAFQARGMVVYRS